MNYASDLGVKLHPHGAEDLGSDTIFPLLSKNALDRFGRKYAFAVLESSQLGVNS
jgi:hypothetical protein